MTDLVVRHGLYAVFGLMALDALLPAASELVLLAAGALATSAFAAPVTLFGSELAKGTQTYLAVATAGTLGYLLGSIAGWALGRYGGRPLLERHPRLFHLPPDRLSGLEEQFARYGAVSVFVARLLPLVRSFVSVAAGILRMPFRAYFVVTLAASIVWTFALAGIGWGAGSAYTRAHAQTRFVDLAVVALLAAGAVVVLVRTRGRRRHTGG